MHCVFTTSPLHLHTVLWNCMWSWGLQASRGPKQLRIQFKLWSKSVGNLCVNRSNTSWSASYTLKFDVYMSFLIITLLNNFKNNTPGLLLQSKIILCSCSPLDYIAQIIFPKIHGYPYLIKRPVHQKKLWVNWISVLCS